MKKQRILLMLLLAGVSWATSFATNQLVPGSFSTIQAAVDAAAATGDEIHITTAGTYSDAVTITDKNLSIIGDVSGVVVGAKISTAGAAVVTLSNLKVSGAAFDGIEQGSTGALTVTNCTIGPNPGRGILHVSAGDVNVSGSTFTQQGFDGYDRGGGSGGKLTVSGNCVFANNGRSGIMVEGGTDPVFEIANTTFQNNNVAIQTTGAPRNVSIQLTDSILRNNPQDQMLFAGKVNLVMTNVTVEHTTSPSFMAGLRFDSSAPTDGVSTAQFTNCQFICPFSFNCFWMGHAATVTMDQCSFNGYASAITVTDNTNAVANLTLRDTTFKGSTSVPVAFNGADGGAAHVLTADRCRFTGGATAFNLVNAVAAQATLTNCVFDGGDTQVWSQGDQAWLKARNCTLVGDDATTCGLNFVNSSAEHLVANCIIDKTYQGLNCSTAVALATVANHNNLIRATAANFVGIAPGTANILNKDPQFVTASSGPGTGDFHLQTTSPAINAGDETLGIALDYDKKNRAAPEGTKPDLGAYEETTAVPVELATFQLD